jgi:hypothetical protein
MIGCLADASPNSSAYANNLAAPRRTGFLAVAVRVQTHRDVRVVPTSVRSAVRGLSLMSSFSDRHAAEKCETYQ